MQATWFMSRKEVCCKKVSAPFHTGTGILTAAERPFKSWYANPRINVFNNVYINCNAKKKLNLLRATRCIFRIDIKEKKTVILKMPTSVKVEPYYPQIGLNAPPPQTYLNSTWTLQKLLKNSWGFSGGFPKHAEMVETKSHFLGLLAHFESHRGCRQTNLASVGFRTLQKASRCIHLPLEALKRLKPWIWVSAGGLRTNPLWIPRPLLYVPLICVVKGTRCCVFQYTD